jgi:hypothetical protein
VHYQQSNYSTMMQKTVAFVSIYNTQSTNFHTEMVCHLGDSMHILLFDPKHMRTHTCTARVRALVGTNLHGGWWRGPSPSGPVYMYGLCVKQIGLYAR